MTHRGPHPAATLSLGFGLRRDEPPQWDNEDASSSTPSRKPHILVVDDDQAMRRILSTRLGAANYDVTCVATAQEGLDHSVRARPHLVITELKMGPTDGFALLKELKSRWPDMTVIILTAHGTIPDAVKATQSGAFGFLVKPVEKDELLGQVKRAIAASSFSRSAGDWRANIVSRSKLMEERLALANGAAAVHSPVMLVGQNGTGKELMARAIHAASPRRDKAFVVIHCRSMSETDLATSIFGDPADPASGALQQTIGGTLFLEDIGELPVRLQARLVNEVRLHAHESTQADNARRLDVRLICTTGSDLKPAIASGQFRQDLYYQIHVMPIEVPPLGRRREDIPLLVSHFLEQATEQTGKQRIYTPKAIELLATKDWPGNVRQLFELVKRNVALTHEEIITEEHVRASLGDEASAVPGYDEAREQFSREYLVENLQRTSGNVAEAARLAKRNRSDFYNLLARFRLNAADFKNAGPEVQTVKPGS